MTSVFRKLIIIGAGGQASNVYGVATDLGYEVAMFIHDKKAGETLYGLPINRTLCDVKNIKDYDFFIGLGDNNLREKYVNEIRRLNSKAFFPKLIHPSVVAAPFSNIGFGSIVMPGSVIGTGAFIGNFCVVGSLSSVGHDCLIRDFSFLGPRSTLAGNVKVGLKSVIGIGAGVREGVTIGNSSLIGAFGFQNVDLGDNKVSLSASRVFVKNRNEDNNYLK